MSRAKKCRDTKYVNGGVEGGGDGKRLLSEKTHHHCCLHSSYSRFVFIVCSLLACRPAATLLRARSGRHGDDTVKVESRAQRKVVSLLAESKIRSGLKSTEKNESTDST
jgi:hypothetical protein